MQELFISLGPDMRVYWCHSREYGSNHDSQVMEHSRFCYKHVHENYRVFPGAVVFADQAYNSYHDWMVIRTILESIVLKQYFSLASVL